MVKRLDRNRTETDDFEIDISEVDVIIPEQEVAESYGMFSNTMSYEDALVSARAVKGNNLIYTARFINDGNSNTLTLNRLNTLCDNPQADLTKVLEIAGYARKAANMYDLHGKIFESIENNINPTFKLSFPAYKGTDKGGKTYANKVLKIQELLQEKFFAVNNISNLISSEVIPIAYIEGNKILNMRRTSDGRYSIESYPLGVATISDYKVYGENLVNISIDALKKRLETIGIKDKSKKKENGVSVVEEELKKHYPEEVAKAYTSKETFATLNYMTTGVIRNKNMGSKYGVSAFLPSFKAMVQLDTIDASDNTNAKARAKKFIVQRLSEKLLGNSGRDKHFTEMNYANDNLYAAASQDAVVVTLPAYSLGIDLLEFQNTMTPIENINYYRYQMMNALGIGFLSVETNSKFTATEVSFKEIVKTVNRLNKQLSAYISKCIYYIIETESPKLLDACPTFVIEDSSLLDSNLRMALSTYVFTMLGSSYETAYGLLGIDADEEKRLREVENEKGFDTIFKPRASMYTTAGGSTDTTTNTDKKEENQNPDKDKQADDKSRNADE